MMVMEATRLPNSTARMGERVTARAMAAPAEKLSPAPQILTGFGIGFVSQNCFVPAPSTVTAFGPSVTINNLALQHSCRASYEPELEILRQAASASSRLGL